MFSAHRARNFRLEQRIIRSSGTSVTIRHRQLIRTVGLPLICSPVAPLKVGKNPGSGGFWEK